MNENNIKARVKIIKTLFHDRVSNYAILAVEPTNIEYGVIDLNTWGNFVVKGYIAEISLVDTYLIVAKELEPTKWGQQFELTYIGISADLTDTEKQRIFLEKILSTFQVNNLYNTFDNPFDLIKDENINELTKAKGIGAKVALKIINKYKSTIDFSEAYIELDKYGLTPKMIHKLIELYGSPELTVKKVKENPYVLIDDIDGIGWKKADALALNAGIQVDSPFRIRAFINYFLKEQAEVGNSYESPNNLMYAIEEHLGDIDDDIIRDTLHNMPELWWDEEKTRIGLLIYRELEQNITNEFIRLMKAPVDFNIDGWEEIIKETEKSQGWEFTDEQLEGIQTILKNPVSLITGYGGTGKSSIVKGMLNVLHRYNFAQCALSGKAASRLSEVTGAEGYTIHRLLAYGFGNPFGFTKYDPLPFKIIILDELSMVGGHLFYSLIQAIADGSKLIMIGDVGQLESIGSLNLINDVLHSGVIPTITLTKIHRQAQKSAIITESINIRNGIEIIPYGFVGKDIRGELEDLELDIYDDKILSLEKIINQFSDKMPLVKNIMEIQIITPMKYRGEVCTLKLNRIIQNSYNAFDPSKREIELRAKTDHSYILREGDKVINVRNNYKTLSTYGETTPIFNGNMGIIKEIDIIEGIMIIDFLFIGEIIIERENWDSIELGYAITIHKSQGSEYEVCIVAGVDYSAFTMLTKELIYTGITRSKKYCVLVAENSALRYAIGQSNISTKKTFLKEFLQEYNNTINNDIDF